MSLANTDRPMLTSLIKRRSVLAAAIGLAVSAVRGNEAAAQVALGDLPDAAQALRQFAPVAAPGLKFTSQTGRGLSLSDYKGHGLVVSIWATWCGPCVAELPSFAAIAPKLAESKILVLPISIDMEGLKAVQPFYASHHITGLPILLDPNGEAPDILNAAGIPVTILITPAGQMVGRLDGGGNWDTPDTVRLVSRLLTGAPVNPVQPV